MFGSRLFQALHHRIFNHSEKELMKKIFFAFPSNRAGTVNRVKNGLSPDNELYGLNHLKNLASKQNIAMFILRFKEF